MQNNQKFIKMLKIKAEISVCLREYFQIGNLLESFICSAFYMKGSIHSGSKPAEFHWANESINSL